jgi:hypothetical protein
MAGCRRLAAAGALPLVTPYSFNPDDSRHSDALQCHRMDASRRGCVLCTSWRLPSDQRSCELLQALLRPLPGRPASPCRRRASLNASGARLFAGSVQGGGLGPCGDATVLRRDHVRSAAVKRVDRATHLLTETQVGKAMPFSNFLPLKMFWTSLENSAFEWI